MLLVHDDQTQRGERSEYRRARPHHYVEPAAARELPVAAPLSHREVAVQHADAAAEAAAELRQHLRAERHLRHQDQRLPSLIARRLRRAQVDLGLAAGGDAVEQDRREAWAGERRLDHAQRLALAGGERHAVAERELDAPVLGRLAPRPAPGEPLEPTGQRRRQHFADRREVVLGDPAPEREQVRAERHLVEHGGHVADVTGIGHFVDGEHDAAPWPAAERDLNLDAGAHARRESFGDAVCERLPHRQRERHGPQQA